MTNREWLETLSDEDFADWCCGGDAIDFKTGRPIGINPHLYNIKYSYADAILGLINWLKAEKIFTIEDQGVV